MAFPLDPDSLDAFQFVLDVFGDESGVSAEHPRSARKGLAAHGCVGAGAVTETFLYDDLLPMGFGMSGGQAAMQVAMPRTASWGGPFPLTSTVIHTGAAPRPRASRAPRRSTPRTALTPPPPRALTPAPAVAPPAVIAAAAAEAGLASAPAGDATAVDPSVLPPPRPSSAPPTLAGALPASSLAAQQAQQGAAFEADGLAAGSKRLASQAFLATLGAHGGIGLASVAGTKKTTRDKNANAVTAAKRSSAYRGVTRHRWTGRFEAHLWDAACERAPGSTRGRQKGKQVYLGGYETEEQAARAYDQAAIKYWGVEATLNYPFEDYADAMEDIVRLTTPELIAHLRRKSSGFSRGASKFRGVTRHHQHGRWEARIGRVMGNKYLYLGTFTTEMEAARAYDRAAIRYRGARAVTNYNVSDYAGEDLSALPEDPALLQVKLSSYGASMADTQGAGGFEDAFAGMLHVQSMQSLQSLQSLQGGEDGGAFAYDQQMQSWGGDGAVLGGFFDQTTDFTFGGAWQA